MKEVTRILFKKLDPDAKLPTKATWDSAGLDLYSLDTAVISPGETLNIRSGLAVEIPYGYFGGIYARSGLSTIHGIRPANCVAVIDSDYRGQIGIPLHNESDKVYKIQKGDRVAQLVIQPCLYAVPVEVKELSDTKRGEYGFGSSGK